MGEYNTVFRRYEKKFLLDGKQYRAFCKRIEPYMQVDEYGESTICNIYYDTDDYQLIRSSIDKPVYKEKLRLRSYGTPKYGDTVFLEIKKKYKGIVYKRRVAMKLEDAYQSLQTGHMTGADGQISNELEYFMQRYSLHPGTFLAYDRTALYGKEDPELRMTFDKRIRSRQQNMGLEQGDYGTLLLPEDQVVLEVKVAEAYPFWLVRILEDLKIYPASFSKYGNVYTKYILPNLLAQKNNEDKGEELCFKVS
ncbi:MAG: polyphosphate polymerase domain-containing protein [Eubacterium sp.]|nr:polyphosphate polymerase domain-containing protein [Eubacterium sp.]